MKVYENYNLKSHNTFGIAAACNRFLVYATVDEACLAAGDIRKSGRSLLIGSGSNLLLTRDFQGLVVTPEPRFEVEVVKEDEAGVELKCWAGTRFDDVIAYAIGHRMYGAENLSWIPGEVGASAVQNIGAYGAEVKDLILRVEAVEIATGKTVVLQQRECEYSYRQSRFKHEWKDKYLITAVVYRLSKTFVPHLDYGNIRAALDAEHIVEPTALQLRETIIRIRQAKLPDPDVLGNAGSFFMNPIIGREQYESLRADCPQMPHYEVDATHVKVPAGWLIDQCGWKGKRVGNVGVHDKQALVLVNYGQATGLEVLDLCRTIQQDVHGRFGIQIYPEVNIV